MIPRYSISEAARLLDRSPHTLRSWDRNESMPAKLRPLRDGAGHRYWTPDLVEAIKEWMEREGFHPGSAMDYHPSPDQVRSHISRIRQATAARGSAEPVVDGTPGNVLMYLRFVGESTERKIASALGRRPTQVRPALTALLSEGLVSKSGSVYAPVVDR